MEMTQQITILVDMAHDCTAALLNHPGLTVADATVERVALRTCRAVLAFSDGATLTGHFTLPEDAPPSFMNAVQGLLYEQSLRIQDAVIAGRELYERVVH